MYKLAAAALAILTVCLSGQNTMAKVYKTISQTYSTATSPLDVTTSEDGRHTFVLTQGGKILIYGKSGQEDEIQVDPSFDHISVAINGDKIFLTSSNGKKVQEILLDFVKHIDITGDPFLGAQNAKVVMVVFSDFQCPHCAKLGPLFEQVLEQYPDKVKIVYKNFPLNMHRFAATAALADFAAQKQGKFWQYHDLIYENYQNLNLNKFNEFAKQLNLNLPQFRKDMESPEAKEAITRDFEEGRRLKVTGTPTIFINGRLLRVRNIAAIQKIIDEELK